MQLIILHGAKSVWTSFRKRAWDGAVVRALVSHQCGPGSNPGGDAICGFSLWLVLSFALLREAFLGILQFSPLLKNQHFQTPI